jgi:hypothetical protein
MAPGDLSSTSAIRSVATATMRPALDGGDGPVRSGLRRVVRVLEQRAEDIRVLRGFVRACRRRVRSRRSSARVLTTSMVCGKQLHRRKSALISTSTPARHGHGFGGGGGFVEQRGVGEFEAGQVDHHLLVVEQRFQAALGDFGLIGRVGGVPARVFQHVAQDDLGRQGVVVAHADHRFLDHVLGSNASMAAVSSALGPMWRWMNSSRCSSALSESLSVMAFSGEGGTGKEKGEKG